MSKKNGKHLNHTDNMVCPVCNGARIMRDQDSDHLLESRTCDMCHNTGQVSRRWLEKRYNKIMDALAPDTPEEVDQYLRENGYDPDELINRMRPRIQKALDESPLNPKNQGVNEHDN